MGAITQLDSLALEFLDQRRRQAAIYVMREVKPTYDIPLGSWVIRELVKQAFFQQPLTFESIADALRSVRPVSKFPPTLFF